MENIRKRVISLFAAALIVTALGGAAFAAEKPHKVIAPGQTVGISLKTKGVIVEDIAQYDDDEKTEQSPAAKAGLMSGDIITHIGSYEIKGAEDMKNALSKSGGAAVTVRFIRGGEEKQIEVTPRDDGKGGYELGLWLRDGVMGMGTVTFYDSDTGIYGALGHPINDSKSGTVIPIEDGDIYEAEITNISKGQTGKPGQLHGDIDKSSEIGTIEDNTMYGIYGTVENSGAFISGSDFEVASEDEIKTGDAEIISSVGGKCEFYSIKIDKIFSGEKGEGKSMQITVTDERLVKLTGGIVQGMSGSPIIQNGKLVGAVTHVLVNDAQKGYGISIEKMLDTAYQSEKAA